MPSAFRVEYVDSVGKAIASFNPVRKLLLIMNESDTTVYISKDPQNIVTAGIALYPFESIVFDVSDADEPEYAFYAQTVSGTAKLRIYESLVG